MHTWLAPETHEGSMASGHPASGHAASGHAASGVDASGEETGASRVSVASIVDDEASAMFSTSPHAADIERSAAQTHGVVELMHIASETTCAESNVL